MNLYPVKICTISSNDGIPLIYIPKDVRQILGLEKGVRILLYVDQDSKRLVVEKLPQIAKEDKPST